MHGAPWNEKGICITLGNGIYFCIVLHKEKKNILDDLETYYSETHLSLSKYKLVTKDSIILSRHFKKPLTESSWKIFSAYASYMLGYIK